MMSLNALAVPIDVNKRQGEEAYLYFHIDPQYTNYVNRILEGYEYVGVMTSLDKSGRCMVRCTPDTRSLASEILSRLPEVTLEI